MAECRQTTKSWCDSGVVYSLVLMAGFLLGTTTGCYEKHLAPQIEYAPKEVETLREEIRNMDWE